jgi:hypothetical protein
LGKGDGGVVEMYDEMVEIYDDGHRKGGEEFKAERWPATSFGVMKQWWSLVGPSSS